MHGCMASTCATSFPVVVPVAPAAASTSSPACPSKKSTASSCRRRCSVSCKAAGGRRGDEEGLLWLPRRDVLTAGLTGVAAGLTGYPGLASAALERELASPCRRGDPVSEKLVQCTDPRGGQIPCPPSLTVPIVDFTKEEFMPKNGEVKRKPVHSLTAEEQARYKEAVRLMKKLPSTHPLSFDEQAAIHEAYCDGHYRYDPTEKNRPFDVHFSWIFAPWHRMYIYFYERALRELIGDDTFALPYWNWDAPAGMVIPSLFTDSPDSNALYDRFRDKSHLNKLMNLDFLSSPKSELIDFDGPKNQIYQEAVNNNLYTIYNQQVRCGKGARNFLGDKLCSETGFRANEINERSKRRDKGNKVQVNKTKSQGSLERMAHTAVHVWTGRACAEEPSTCAMGHDSKPHCKNDMGFLGTAGRDPLFYSHHANVDRMWHLWSTKLGGGEGFQDKEWRDAAFVFYDGVQNMRRVRIKFSDVLDTSNLGYTYDADSEKELPWLKLSKLTALVPRGTYSSPPGKAAPEYPLTLRKGVPVVVPAVALPPTPPGAEQQRVLVIDGIEYDPAELNKFDVAINVPKESAAKVGPRYNEYVGSFAVVPSSVDGGGKLQGKASLCLEEVLADIGAAGDTTIDVLLVPRTIEEITISKPLTVQNIDLN